MLRNIMNFLTSNQSLTNDEDTQLVLSAVMSGDIDTLKQLAMPVTKGGKGINIKQVEDNNGNTAVLYAVASGQSEMLGALLKSKKKGGLGCSLKTKNNSGYDPVLLAIAQGQKDIFNELIGKKRNGGYGLSLKTKNIYKSDPVLIAAGFGQVEMLRLLAKSKNDGGHGLSLGIENINQYGPIHMAVMNNHTDMLEVLTLDKANDGYDLPLKDIDSLLALADEYNCDKSMTWLVAHEMKERMTNFSLFSAVIWSTTIVEKFSARHDLKSDVCIIYQNLLTDILKKQIPSEDDHVNMILLLETLGEYTQDNDDLYSKLFMREFNHKDFNNKQAALTWAMATFPIYSEYCPKLAATLCERYKKMLTESVKHPSSDIANSAFIKQLINAIDNIYPGEGRLFYANLRLVELDYVEAYKYYASVHTDTSCRKDLVDHASIEMANMVLVGYVVLKENKLDKLASMNRSALTESERREEGRNDSIMKERANAASIMLSGNDTETSNIMKNCLEKITLQGNYFIDAPSTISISESGLSLFNQNASIQIQHEVDHKETQNLSLI